MGQKGTTNILSSSENSQWGGQPHTLPPRSIAHGHTLQYNCIICLGIDTISSRKIDIIPL